MKLYNLKLYLKHEEKKHLNYHFSINFSQNTIESLKIMVVQGENMECQ